MEERINELLSLIDTQLAMTVSDPVTESYKARNLENYSRTLINLLNARKIVEERENGRI